ncbi:MAG: sugar phosphate isomerase/epimerase [Planctomycetes bacterium]|nr:sugar phosphate isomerase/epimerase [Planctomycetota bacterium]
MIGFRIAAQTGCFAQPFKKALHTAARLECDGVQFDARQELRPAELSETGLRQLRKILNDLNLRVASVAFPTRRGYANPDDLERRLEATLAAMRLASQLRARILIFNLGDLPAAESTAAATLIDAISSLAVHGNRLGVRLTAQATSADAQALVDFVDSLPEGTLALDLHPARLIAQGESPAEFVSVAGRHIAHVHATDGVHDLASGHGVEVELGRGTADFPELLGMLEEFEYRDWLTIERRDSRQPVEDIGNAVRYLRTLSQ